MPPAAARKLPHAGAGGTGVNWQTRAGGSASRRGAGPGVRHWVTWMVTVRLLLASSTPAAVVAASV